jgi:hypothetical protein
MSNRKNAGSERKPAHDTAGESTKSSQAKVHSGSESGSAQARYKNWPPEDVMNPPANHMWSREVIFDFHEVCVKWLKRFCDFYNKQYGTNVKPEDVEIWNMQFSRKAGVLPEQFDRAFVAFSRAAVGGYGDLEPHDGIKETMERIVAAGIKVRIWSWTPSASDIKPDGAGAYNTSVAQDVTKRLIRRLGLPVDVDRDIDFMPPGRKKWEMVEEHIPLIVEDNRTTASDVADAGHAVILVPEKYNEGLVCPNVLRLSDRKDLADVIIDFYRKLDEAGLLL